MMALDHEAAPPANEIWYTRCPVPTGSGLAIQNGQLKTALEGAGFRINSLRNSADPATRESHFTHRLPASFRQGGNAPALYAKASGSDTVLLGLQHVPEYQAILTTAESGIRTPEDLAGRRFALPRRLHDKIDFLRATYLQGYLAALKLGGVGREAAEWVDLPVAATYFEDTPRSAAGTFIDARRLLRQQTPEIVALLQGKVDVIYGHSVWGAALRDQFGLHEVVNLANYDDPAMAANNEQPVTLTVSRDLLVSNPEAVDLYVLETLRGAAWARANRVEAARLLALELGTAEYWLDEGICGDFVESLQVDLDAEKLRWLEVRKDFLLTEGFLPADIDISRWMDPGPLARARERLAEKP